MRGRHAFRCRVLDIKSVVATLAFSSSARLSSDGLRNMGIVPVLETRNRPLRRQV